MQSISTASAISIEVKNLSKSFGPQSKPAVADLNFALRPGEAVAFLGPNGAGKSTTIKMLCGIISPSQGSATIQGFPAGSHQANKRLGLVFGTRSQLYLHMTVAQCLDLIAEIYYVTGPLKKHRIEKLAHAFDAQTLMSRRVRTLSLGQRMRCEVIAALIHNPSILLLDEPTIGLDLVAKNQLRNFIVQWQATEKTTLMLTSHDFSDVEALCNRCILIDQGVKRFDGELNALKGELAWVRRIRITTKVRAQEFKSPSPHLVNIDPKDLKESSEFVHEFELASKNFPMSEALQILSAFYGPNLQDIQINEITLEEVLTSILAGQKR